MNFIHHWRRNSLDLSLKGSSSTTLISCFAKSIWPNSPGSREKGSWYSVNRAWAATWFPSDHLSRSDKSSCWKSSSFLCSTNILILWIPCISYNFFRVLGVTSTGGTTFSATTWVTLVPWVIVIRMAVRFFTTTATCLLPEITLVYVFTTLKPWGKWGPSPLSEIESLHAYCFPGAGFSFCHVLFWMKKHLSLPLCHFDCLIQISQIHCFVCMQFPSELKVAYWNANNWAILDPFKETSDSSI